MLLPSSANASPFRFAGDRRGILLVHGFTGSPFEMRLLGESLALRGYSVAGPRLAGHEPGPRDLAGTTWHDWYRSVEDAWVELARDCTVVGVCGLSLGGLLCLELARRHPGRLAALAILGAPLHLRRWEEAAIALAQRIGPARRFTLPKFGGSDLGDPALRRINPNPAGGLPLRALQSLVDVMAHVRPALEMVHVPTFLAQGGLDGPVPADCIDELARRLPGPVERMDLPRSRHVVTLDVERDALFRRLGEFFDRHLGHATDVPRAALA